MPKEPEPATPPEAFAEAEVLLRWSRSLEEHGLTYSAWLVRTIAVEVAASAPRP